MSVSASDIKFYLTGGAANADPNASLGGTTSSVEITAATLNNLFDNISAAEAIEAGNPYIQGNGGLDHRAIAVKNTHATDTLFSAKIWGGMVAEASTFTSFWLALDSGTQSIADEATAPSAPSLSFDGYTDETDSLTLGDIAAGTQKRVWIRRAVTSAAPAYSADQKTITVKGQTT